MMNKVPVQPKFESGLRAEYEFGNRNSLADSFFDSLFFHFVTYIIAFDETYHRWQRCTADVP